MKLEIIVGIVMLIGIAVCVGNIIFLFLEMKNEDITEYPDDYEDITEYPDDYEDTHESKIINKEK